MLCTLESSCLLDDDKEKEDDEDIEEDDKTDVPCKWFPLADQLLLVPFLFLGVTTIASTLNPFLHFCFTHWTINDAVTNSCSADQFEIIFRSAIPAR